MNSVSWRQLYHTTRYFCQTFCRSKQYSLRRHQTMKLSIENLTSRNFKHWSLHVQERPKVEQTRHDTLARNLPLRAQRFEFRFHIHRKSFDIEGIKELHLIFAWCWGDSIHMRHHSTIPNEFPICIQRFTQDSQMSTHLGVRASENDNLLKR